MNVFVTFYVPVWLEGYTYLLKQYTVYFKKYTVEFSVTLMFKDVLKSDVFESSLLCVPRLHLFINTVMVRNLIQFKIKMFCILITFKI